MGLFCARKRANFAVLPAAFLERKNTHAGGVSVFALSERGGGPRKICPFSGVKMPKWGCFAPENGQILRFPPPRF